MLITSLFFPEYKIFAMRLSTQNGRLLVEKRVSGTRECLAKELLETNKHTNARKENHSYFIIEA